MSPHSYLAVAGTAPPFLETPVQHLDDISALKVELADFVGRKGVKCSDASGRVEIEGLCLWLGRRRRLISLPLGLRRLIWS